MHIGPVYVIAGDDARKLLTEALAPYFADLSRKIDNLKQEIHHVAVTINDLIAKVQALKTVDDSVLALIQGIKAQLEAAIAANDPAALQVLADSLDAETARLQAAVTANTGGGGGTP